MSGLFGTFNIAKRGMFTQQKALDVTSHNIANANTLGYSRQRAKIETTRPFATPSIHNVAEPGQMGTGAQISAIERIRDSFLDFQVRSETSTLGQYETRYKFLSEVESILNEPTDTGISTLMGEFFKSWQELSKHPESSNARTVAAEKSAALATALNHTYNQLQNLKGNSSELTKDAVGEINGVLNQVDKLNQEIMAVKVSGKMPNDLMDKRDLLIDELSKKFNINIEKDNYEGINLNPEGSNLDMIRAVNNTEDVYRLSYVDGVEKVKDEATGEYTGEIKITYYKFGDKLSAENKVTISLKVDKDDVESTAKTLEQSKVIWTDTKGLPVNKNDGKILYKIDPVTKEPIKDANGNLQLDGNFADSLFEPLKGEIKGLMSIDRDVEKYEDELNKLAKALAWSVNAIHTKDIDAADNPLNFFVNKDGGTEDEINAGNIAVNEEIIKDVMKITVGKDKNSGESDNVRALAIAALKDTMLMIQEIGETINTREELIGSAGWEDLSKGFYIKNNIKGIRMDSYFKDMVNTLGTKSQEAKRMVNNQKELLASFEEARLSTSGVSLDEEMANLIQFQHAYQANAKIIATVDELLDVVINGLKK